MWFWIWVLAFKKRFLPIVSTKYHFQTLHKGWNWSTKGGKQENQGLRCLNNSITWKTPKCYTSSKNMCIYRFFIFNQWLKWNARMQIIAIKSCRLIGRWSNQMKLHHRVKFDRHVTSTVRSSSNAWYVPTHPFKSMMHI